MPLIGTLHGLPRDSTGLSGYYLCGPAGPEAPDLRDPTEDSCEVVPSSGLRPGPVRPKVGRNDIRIRPKAITRMLKVP
eukprot:13142360-Heterocapsa_arctica.AAC.1